MRYIYVFIMALNRRDQIAHTNFMQSITSEAKNRKVKRLIHLLGLEKVFRHSRNQINPIVNKNKKKHSNFNLSGNCPKTLNRHVPTTQIPLIIFKGNHPIFSKKIYADQIKNPRCDA